MINFLFNNYLNNKNQMTLDYSKLIEETEVWVKDKMKDYDCSHNFDHVLRVKKMAIKIAFKEDLKDFDIFKIVMGALTHDVADSKYSSIPNEQETSIKEFLKDKISDNSIIDEIVYIACNTSLSKEVANIHNIDKNNINLKCVQDADRIDSLGSIGICRYFMYGIHKNKSKINDIITNINNRSKIVLKFIKTKYGRKIAKRKYKIIHKFIKNYKKDLKI
jgi:uncharacterized protein